MPFKALITSETQPDSIASNTSMLYNIGSICVDTLDVPSDIKIIKISIFYLTLGCLFHNVVISS
nr:CPPV033 hypothetical protein [Cooks petrelpox virus]